MPKMTSSVRVRRRKDKPGRPWTVFPRHNGKRLRSVSFGDNKVAAQQFADKLILEMKDKNFKFKSTKEQRTLADYGTEVLTQRGQRKEGSMSNYRSAFKCHIKDTPLGQMEISTIGRDDVLAFLNAMSLDNSIAQRLFIYRVLSGILTRAVMAKIIDHSPCSRLGREVPKDAEDRLEEMEEIVVLTNKQGATLLKRLRAQTPDIRKFGVFYTMDQAGLRIGEAQAVKNECWDFVKKVIVIKYNVSDSKLDTPKSHQMRPVPMTPSLELFAKAIMGPNPDPKAFTFANRNNTFFDYEQLRSDVWNPAADGLGIGRVTSHILRHTFAARFLGNGQPIQDLTKILGHHSREFTLKHYGHLQPTGKGIDVSAIDRPAPLLHLVSSL